LTTEAQAQDHGHVIGVNDDRLPVCMFPDSTRLDGATIRQVSDKPRWLRTSSRIDYASAILGAGPVGLSPAVYGASEGLKTMREGIRAEFERCAMAVGDEAIAVTFVRRYLSGH
jgi:thioredoxin reductase (NADPH)